MSANSYEVEEVDFQFIYHTIDLGELFDKIFPQNCRSQMVKLLKWQGDWHWRKVYW